MASEGFKRFLITRKKKDFDFPFHFSVNENTFAIYIIYCLV